MKPINDEALDLRTINGESDVDSLENSNNEMLEESGSSGCGSDVEEDEEGCYGSDEPENEGSGSDEESDSGSGSWDYNNYTEEEYNEMLRNGTWHGGYVNGVYVMPQVTEEENRNTDGGGGGNSGGTSSGGYSGGSAGTNPNTGNGQPNPNNNNGQQGGGTQDNNHSQTPTQDSYRGTFKEGVPYYTEEEMESMYEQGKWQGGNVLTLGFVGEDYDIVIPRHQISTSWLTTLSDLAIALVGNVAGICNHTMSLPYVQATKQYNVASGEPLTLNVNSLGLHNLTNSMLKGDPNNPDIKRINLLEHIGELTYGLPNNQKTLVVNTAITLGNITFRHVGDNRYTIVTDTYDFDLANRQGEHLRNIETILGAIVQEGICMYDDAYYTPLIGGLTLKSICIANGIIRRHLLGETTFKILFNGTIYIQP